MDAKDQIYITYISCAIIIGFAIYVAYGMIGTYIRLRGVLKRFNNEIKVEENDYSEGASSDDDVWYGGKENVTYNGGKLRKCKDDYYNIYANYVVCSQCIALFPLLGIMGTVIGLITNNDPQNVDALVSGLGTALVTTLLGLIFSVVYKYADARWLGKNVNLIDSEFEKAESVIQRQRMAEAIRKEIKEANSIKEGIELNEEK